MGFTGRLVFAQLAPGVLVGGGASPDANHWSEGSPRPYTGSALVDNAPTPNELLALWLPSENTITFSSPVENPLMAISSQGSIFPGSPDIPVVYDFDTPFSVLSSGRGYWGIGGYALGPEKQLIGTELHGVIQFEGTVTSIGWSSTKEFWHGFTIGLTPDATSPVPGAGSTVMLLAMALAGLRLVPRPSGSRSIPHFPNQGQSRMACD